eukprot:TRINITY_DN6818_c0_g2_i1.p1 TRINITY_DN6818_c0_g2~~TRINITY_DN6818_c0_g2_i1.p1  ORF type:complete len:145 (-),score=25.33 TRINITY_DN6818_c0_g2_i1:31-444(-)
MASENLRHPGKVASYSDSRGDIFRISIGGDKFVNLMRTAGGVLRSGDVHNCTQFDVILSGRTRLRLMNMERGGETVCEYDGAYNYIAIPARVPHLFEFMEENYMIKWWDCDFHAWHYKPYREKIQISTARSHQNAHS